MSAFSQLSRLGVALVGLGVLLSVVSNVWLIVAAFRAGIGWGLATLFLPLASLVFVIMRWTEAAKPFIVGLVGTLLIVGGTVASVLDLRRLAATHVSPETTGNVAAREPSLFERVSGLKQQPTTGGTNTLAGVTVGDAESLVFERLGEPKIRIKQDNRVYLLFSKVEIWIEDDKVSFLQPAELTPPPPPPARESSRRRRP